MDGMGLRLKTNEPILTDRDQLTPPLKLPQTAHKLATVRSSTSVEVPSTFAPWEVEPLLARTLVTTRLVV